MFQSDSDLLDSFFFAQWKVLAVIAVGYVSCRASYVSIQVENNHQEFSTFLGSSCEYVPGCSKFGTICW